MTEMMTVICTTGKQHIGAVVFEQLKMMTAICTIGKRSADSEREKNSDKHEDLRT